MSFYATILSQKGGVGKSTTTINLAACLARNGRRGIVVDLNHQQRDSYKYAGSIPGVEWVEHAPPRPNDDSFVVVDTAPQVLGEVGLPLSQSNLVIVPCNTDPYALESLERSFATINNARKKNPDLIPIVLFTCVDRSGYDAGAIAAARVLSQWPVAIKTIPFRKLEFISASDARIPLVLKFPKSAGAVAYRDFTAEIEAILSP